MHTSKIQRKKMRKTSHLPLILVSKTTALPYSHTDSHKNPAEKTNVPSVKTSAFYSPAKSFRLFLFCFENRFYSSYYCSSLSSFRNLNYHYSCISDGSFNRYFWTDDSEPTHSFPISDFSFNFISDSLKHEVVIDQMFVREF